MMYAAYGSNMNLDQMAHRCPWSRPVENAKIPGWKLVFRGVLDIVHTGNDEDYVPVVLWKIAREDWDELDMYEGYPRLYTRQIVPVITADGTHKKAVAYVMTGMIESRYQIDPPYEYYWDTCYDGCLDNGIDPAKLIQALNESWEAVEHAGA